jgi:hypothetical protein
MSTIQKISRAKGIVYRVLIRKSGIKAITKTFPTKKEAIQFSQKIEGSIQEKCIVQSNTSIFIFEVKL